MRTQSSTTLPTVHDVIIIGAGPCGLAVAARLREKTPSALFTDEEHQRYYWINRHAGKAAIRSRKTGSVRTAQSKFEDSPSMLVLDSSGDRWMTRWDRLFDDLKITHLRSPMFFHPDPHDRDGLQAYTHEQGRGCECIEIAGCVGKEMSKHQTKKKRNRREGQAAKAAVTIDERDRKDYFAPPSDLFREYCTFIAKRYGLLEDGLIRQASVIDVDYDIVPLIDTENSIFTVKTNSEHFYARSVVLAVGAGNQAVIPAPFPVSDCECACHVFDNALPARMAEANILVIGGGLTSAQVVDRAIRQGASKVWHLMRGPMKVKPFDVDLSWMGKFKNHEKATFWSADTDGDRAEMVRSARGGGSITPRYQKILQEHRSSGKLSVHCSVKVHQQHWDEERKLWTIQTDPHLPDLPDFDHIYFATGVQSDIKKLDFMQTMLAKHKIDCFDGNPALTDDLEWKNGVPLFVSGKFASLRLGPGAGNLEGARTGAERIAWALQDVLQDDAEDERSSIDVLRYQIGLGSRFESLLSRAVESY